ncbi:CARDB domain-containing protein [Actinoplanes sp. CA-030573]|uniref:CARDB domain-containing protein n=1 Tax=Actinoplanes sp. CA-030573 TaxID=3239898 RepID=UPI003D946AC6
MTAESPATGPQPTAGRDLTIATFIGVVASICGALLAEAFGHGTPTTRLVGAAVAAAVAALFSVTGPYLHLRAAAGVLVTVLALAITYSGAKVAEAVAKPSTEIFAGPGSSGAADPPTTPPTTGAPSATPTGDGTCGGGVCILVQPATLHCTPTACDFPVTVSDPGGRRALRVTRLELVGPDAADFRYDAGCTGDEVPAGKPCRIEVAFTGTTAGRATLVIHQNLKGPASRVALIGEPGPSPSTDSGPDALPDLTISGTPQCSVIRNGSLTGADNLTIFLAVRNAGPGPVDRLVPFRLTSDTGLAGSGNTAAPAAGDSVTGMQVDLSPGDYHRSHRFTITADPRNEIPEQYETNNSRRVTVSLQSRPRSEAAQPCWLS